MARIEYEAGTDTVVSQPIRAGMDEITELMRGIAEAERDVMATWLIFPVREGGAIMLPGNRIIAIHFEEGDLAE
jgi:hypothetical protein